MNKISVLVGNIASGRSTYVSKYPDAVVISKDDIRKIVAKSIGGEYIYEEHVESAIQNIVEELLNTYLYLRVKHIIIDETHMRTSSRAWVIKEALYLDYKIEAIVFKDLGEDIHVSRRLKDNHGEVSEDIWRYVYRRKKNRYIEPTIEEGFDEIVFVG